MQDKYVIVIGSVNELNTTIGIFDSEQEAQDELNKLEGAWWHNGERYSGTILPLNILDSRTIRTLDNGAIYLGDN